MERTALEVNTLISFGNDQYVIENVLGYGGSGIVYRARQINDQENAQEVVAIKEIYPVYPEIERNEIGEIICNGSNVLDKYKEMATQEKKLCMRVQNQIPDVMSVRSLYPCATINSRQIVNNTYLIFAVGQGYTLEQWVKELKLTNKYSVEVILEAFLKVVDAVDHLHNKCHVIHGDLKNENVYYQMGNIDAQNKWILLLDMASATDQSETKDRYILTADKRSISKGYTPPEGLTNKEIVVSYSYDVFALTSSLFHLLVDVPDYIDQRLSNYSDSELESEITDCLVDYDMAKVGNEVIQKAIAKLIIKGLRREASDRFQNCGELEKEVTQLQETIRNNGITTAILRENVLSIVNSQKDYTSIIESCLPPAAYMEDDYKNLYEAIRQAEGTFFQIIGDEGGTGKTTSMLFLQKKLIYEDNTVPLYVDLSRYQGNEDYIARFVLGNYIGMGTERDFNNLSIKEKADMLEKLIKKDEENTYYFLIDGVQDSGDPYGDNIFRELRAFFGCQNVKILISSRFELESFKRRVKNETIWVKRLSPAMVEEEIKKKTGKIIDINLLNDEMRQLLTKPMNLIMFIGVAVDIVDLDLTGLKSEADLYLANHKRLSQKIATGTKTRFHIYVVDTVLPQLFFRFEKNKTTSLTSNEVRSIIDTINKDMVEKDAATEVILKDVSWSEIVEDLVVAGIIKERKEYEKTIYLVHQNYVDFYSALNIKRKLDLSADEIIPGEVLEEEGNKVDQLLFELFGTKEKIVDWINKRCCIDKEEEIKKVINKRSTTARLFDVIRSKTRDFSKLSFKNIDFELSNLLGINLEKSVFVNCHFLSNAFDDNSGIFYVDCAEGVNLSEENIAVIDEENFYIMRTTELNPLFSKRISREGRLQSIVKNGNEYIVTEVCYSQNTPVKMWSLRVEINNGEIVNIQKVLLSQTSMCESLINDVSPSDGKKGTPFKIHKFKFLSLSYVLLSLESDFRQHLFIFHFDAKSKKIKTQKRFSKTKCVAVRNERIAFLQESDTRIHLYWPLKNAYFNLSIEDEDKCPNYINLSPSGKNAIIYYDDRVIVIRWDYPNKPTIISTIFTDNILNSERQVFYLEDNDEVAVLKDSDLYSIKRERIINTSDLHTRQETMHLRDNPNCTFTDQGLLIGNKEETIYFKGKDQYYTYYFKKTAGILNIIDDNERIVFKRINNKLFLFDREKLVINMYNPKDYRIKEAERIICAFTVSEEEFFAFQQIKNKYYLLRVQLDNNQEWLRIREMMAFDSTILAYEMWNDNFLMLLNDNLHIYIVDCSDEMKIIEDTIVANLNMEMIPSDHMRSVPIIFGKSRSFSVQSIKNNEETKLILAFNLNSITAQLVGFSINKTGQIKQEWERTLSLRNGGHLEGTGRSVLFYDDNNTVYKWEFNKFYEHFLIESDNPIDTEIYNLEECEFIHGEKQDVCLVGPLIIVREENKKKLAINNTENGISYDLNLNEKVYPFNIYLSNDHSVLFLSDNKIFLELDSSLSGYVDITCTPSSDTFYRKDNTIIFTTGGRREIVRHIIYLHNNKAHFDLKEKWYRVPSSILVDTRFKGCYFNGNSDLNKYVRYLKKAGAIIEKSSDNLMIQE